MKETHLIVVGKLKDKNLEDIEASYLERLNLCPLKIHEVKNNAENKEEEGQNVLKKIDEIAPTGAYIIALHEQGREFDSFGFSEWLFKHIEYNSSKLIFVIAGANGHHENVLKRTSEKLSLSRLTFPHKIARILFVEQFYRAYTIKSKHPYHN